MIDWKKFISKEFWTKAELSYQCVHLLLGELATLFVLFVLNGAWYGMFTGLVCGLSVEASQWVQGNHKLEDAIRDIASWTIGGLLGYFLYF